MPIARAPGPAGASESTPLLSHGNSGSSCPPSSSSVARLQPSSSTSSLGDDSQTLCDSKNNNSSSNEQETTPLPMRSLAILALLRLCDPVCFYVVFPFIPSMIRDLHIVDSDEQVGYLAGVIVSAITSFFGLHAALAEARAILQESAFSVAQFATILMWSRLSDHYGRKPILLAGALGSAISVLGMGTSTSFVGLIISRCICGCFSGSTGVMKAAIGEITDPTNRARALTISPLMAGVGASLGPMIGSLHVANSGWSLMDRHPYLAPCLAASLVPLASFLVALFFLPETLQVEEQDRSKSSPDGATISDSPKGPRPLKDLMTRDIVTILSNYSMLVFVGTAFLAITPVLCFTKPAQGGLGFEPRATGSLLAFRGIMTIVIQTVFFPILDRRIGSARLFQLVTLVFPFIFLSSPLLVLLAQQGHRLAVAAAFSLDMALWATGNMAYSCGTMLVVAAAPSAQDLGSLNGIVQSSAAGVRAFSPASATTLYALSVDKHWLGGQLWWISLGAVSCCMLPLSSMLRQPREKSAKGV